MSSSQAILPLPKAGSLDLHLLSKLHTVFCHLLSLLMVVLHLSPYHIFFLKHNVRHSPWIKLYSLAAHREDRTQVTFESKTHPPLKH